jgi:peptidoglycan/LPS O-acetylase OafA/YrhL
MAVVLYHFLDFSNRTPSQTDERLATEFLNRYLPGLQRGYLAVDFFFMLSGFVLAHVYFRQIEEGTYRHSHFLKKRFARIYPLHLAVMVLLVVMVLVGESLNVGMNKADRFSIDGFFLNVFLANGLNLIQGLTWNGPSWCVSSEWHAYLAFPVVALATIKFPAKSYVTLMFSLALFGIVYICSPSPPLTQRTYDWGTLRMAVEFSIGLSLYLVYRDYVRTGAKIVRTWHVWLTLFVTFCAFQAHVEEGLIVLLLTLSIFILAASETYAATPWISHPWLLFGGEISYAIYLIHGPFLACAKKIYPHVGVVRGSVEELIADTTTVLLVVPLAAIAYRLIETPGYRWTLQRLESGL